MFQIADWRWRIAYGSSGGESVAPGGTAFRGYPAGAKWHSQLLLLGFRQHSRRVDAYRSEAGVRERGAHFDQQIDGVGKL